MSAGLTPHVYEHGGAVYVDSRQVAEAFGKRHFHVLRDIANLLKSSTDPILDWFKPCVYVIEKHLGGTEERPFYELTKDGFTLLAMGFTGEKALQFKIAYIERFNRMEALLPAEAAMRV